MIFILSKTSDMFDSRSINPPHKKAFIKKFPILETSHHKSIEKYDNDIWKNDHLDKWLSQGTNHSKNESGYITREIGEEEKWCIEINTLEELMDFKNEIKELYDDDLILTESRSVNEIEIYNYYRE